MEINILMKIIVHAVRAIVDKIFWYIYKERVKNAPDFVRPVIYKLMEKRAKGKRLQGNNFSVPVGGKGWIYAVRTQEDE